MFYELQGLLILVAVWYLHGAFADLFVSMYRDRLFEIRDDAWMHACRAGLLDDPVHRQLRDTLNKSIRWGHLVDSAMVPFILFHRRELAPRRAVLDDIWMPYLERSYQATFTHAARRAPLLISALFLRFVGELCVRAVSRAIVRAARRMVRPGNGVSMGQALAARDVALRAFEDYTVDVTHTYAETRELKEMAEAA